MCIIVCGEGGATVEKIIDMLLEKFEKMCAAEIALSIATTLEYLGMTEKRTIKKGYVVWVATKRGVYEYDKARLDRADFFEKTSSPSEPMHA